jgi:5-methylcytosine-specific restriction endonuclease McrA
MNIAKTKRPWEKSRQSSSPDCFYQSKQWQSIRNSFRSMTTTINHFNLSNKLCIECYKEGTIKEANVVDHILQRKHGGTDDYDNLQSLCDHHHNIKSANEGNTK